MKAAVSPAIMTCLVLALAGGALGQLSVLSSSPANGANDARQFAPIEITFDQNVDPTSVSASTFHVFGRWSGVVAGTRAVNGAVVTFTPSVAFSYGEPVSVMLTTGLASTGGAALATTWVMSYWVQPQPADFAWTAIQVIDVAQPGEGNIISYGGYAGDLDNDGYPDLSIVNEATADVRVYMNDGTGTFPTTFIDHDLPPGSLPSFSEGADLNGDGWTDLAVCNISGNSVGVFLNDGAGGYLPPAVYAASSQPRGLAFVDVESDGDLDIVAACRGTGKLALLLNDGAGVFGAPAILEAGVLSETSIAAADANGDGILDIFVGGFSSQDVALLLGNGTGSFVFSAVTPVGGSPWMLASGDIDGDGFADVAACTSNSGLQSVVLGDGAGGLAPVTTYTSGAFALAIDLGDVDGDGDLDMCTSNYSGGDFTVRENLGGGVFGAAVSLPASIAGSCMLVVDCDADGDVELVGIDELDDKLFIYDSNPFDVQPCMPDACLTVNGAMGGFGGEPAVGLSAGSMSTLAMGALPGQPYVLAAGLGVDPGTPTTGGVANIDVSMPYLIVANGFASPAFVTNGLGQSSFGVGIPAATPVGLTISLQGAVVNPANLAAGFTATNPVRVTITP